VEAVTDRVKAPTANQAAAIHLFRALITYLFLRCFDWTSLPRPRAAARRSYYFPEPDRYSSNRAKALRGVLGAWCRRRVVMRVRAGRIISPILLD
jgi:hypothetical protein